MQYELSFHLNFFLSTSLNSNKYMSGEISNLDGQIVEVVEVNSTLHLQNLKEPTAAAMSILTFLRMKTPKNEMAPMQNGIRSNYCNEKKKWLQIGDVQS